MTAIAAIGGTRFGQVVCVWSGRMRQVAGLSRTAVSGERALRRREHSAWIALGRSNAARAREQPDRLRARPAFEHSLRWESVIFGLPEKGFLERNVPPRGALAEGQSGAKAIGESENEKLLPKGGHLTERSLRKSLASIFTSDNPMW